MKYFHIWNTVHTCITNWLAVFPASFKDMFSNKYVIKWNCHVCPFLTVYLFYCTVNGQYTCTFNFYFVEFVEVFVLFWLLFALAPVLRFLVTKPRSCSLTYKILTKTKRQTENSLRVNFQSLKTNRFHLHLSNSCHFLK
jgi:hypothetical protein